jgi:hypothetical protein
MSGIVDFLGGILRYFPNTIIVTLFFIGIAVGKLPWILVAIGGVLATILTLMIQYIFQKFVPIPMSVPGEPSAVIAACSLLPDAEGGTYMAVPSLWVAISSFVATYIFVNASNIYSQEPARINRNKLAVQQRKGMGFISMFAVALLFFFLLVPRYWTACETIFGTILGLFIGIGWGWIWWVILDACGSDVYPDVHGVMIGLRPGSLHTNPVACAPRLA